LGLAVGPGDEAADGDADLACRHVVVEAAAVLEDGEQVDRRTVAALPV
jgi:hypothetical protein